MKGVSTTTTATFSLLPRFNPLLTASATASTNLAPWATALPRVPLHSKAPLSPPAPGGQPCRVEFRELGKSDEGPESENTGGDVREGGTASWSCKEVSGAVRREEEEEVLGRDGGLISGEPTCESILDAFDGRADVLPVEERRPRKRSHSSQEVSLRLRILPPREGWWRGRRWRGRKLVEEVEQRFCESVLF